MKLLLSFVVACFLYISAEAKESPPKVQVYSYSTGEFGKPNHLICHVSEFHPPDINIELLRNGVVITEAKQTDLAFEQGWKFHLTKSVPFTPQKNEEYACRVTHMQKAPQKYSWDPDM
ncbi:beta-2-microglobulin [Astyanax mexicanus]|uniref:Beta-2-microglobulin n=1 Tax=Astyanax mexicanus TaxID=7994 RepID=W5KVN5_ASTMX|nr:beta-2-microglobulin [Astyanax mexicanus]